MIEISSAPQNHKSTEQEGGGDGVVGGWMPGEVLLRGPWALWQRDPAKELCCDKSDSQPYFYSSINLIGKKKIQGAVEALHRQEMSKLLSGAALVEHAVMTIIYFCCRPGSRF